MTFGLDLNFTNIWLVILNEMNLLRSLHTLCLVIYALCDSECVAKSVFFISFKPFNVLVNMKYDFFVI